MSPDQIHFLLVLGQVFLWIWIVLAAAGICFRVYELTQSLLSYGALSQEAERWHPIRRLGRWHIHMALIHLVVKVLALTLGIWVVFLPQVLPSPHETFSQAISRAFLSVIFIVILGLLDFGGLLTFRLFRALLRPEP